ncbi:NAD(P)H-hydrate epimerase [Escherichia coli]
MVDLIVDALLGNRFSRQAPRESISQLIDHANSHPAPIVAVDIPSGLLAETGATPGAVINADHTITFIALKPGLLTGKARDVTGQLHFDSLGLDSWLAGQETKISGFQQKNFLTG